VAEQILNYADTDAASGARRARGSARPALLAAAREVFQQRGYAGATTREIAQRAGASEPLVFRYFGSKANLFRLAVVQPFDEFIDQFSQDWTNREDHVSPDSPAREFVRWLYRHLLDNRQAVVTLMTAYEHEHDLDINLTGAQTMLDRLAAVVEHETRLRGWTASNVPVATRVIVGMVAASALAKDWLFAGDLDTHEDDIVDEMLTFIVNGFTRASATASARVIDQPELGRLTIHAATAPEVISSMHDWITDRTDLEIVDLAWRPATGTTGTEAHVYYRHHTPTSPNVVINRI
jgi:AcrR family transcriptional regulator